MTGWYRGDLAYIHDVGHADSAPSIVEILDQGAVKESLVPA
jgi:hypothetical protein